MKQVNVHQAKSQLSRLLAAVEAGEEVIIARAGKPVARLTLVVAEPERKIYREPGVMKGKITFAPDWDSPETNAEIAELFYASDNDEELFGPPPAK
jgi:antitoxin (DNA-binding transcriptional repressor) of toxin-antitoxin stability system